MYDTKERKSYKTKEEKLKNKEILRVVMNNEKETRVKNHEKVKAELQRWDINKRNWKKNRMQKKAIEWRKLKQRRREQKW